MREKQCVSPPTRKEKESEEGRERERERERRMLKMYHYIKIMRGEGGEMNEPCRKRERER